MMSDPYHAFEHEESMSSNRGRRSVGADDGGRVGWGLVLPALACAESRRRLIGRLNSASTMSWEWHRNLILDRRRLSRQFCSEKHMSPPSYPGTCRGTGVEGLRPEAVGFSDVCLPCLHVLLSIRRHSSLAPLPHSRSHLQHP